MRALRKLLFLAALALTAGCPSTTPPAAPTVSVEPTPKPGPPPADAAPGPPRREASTLLELAEAARRAFVARDGDALAELSAPEGVRFTPYAFVDARDVVIPPRELRTAFDDLTVRTWGAYDGTGDPIDLTFADYVARFVVPIPFTGAEVAENTRLGFGNSIDNIATFYPQAQWVEYHVAQRDPRYEGMDWVSLRLVFRSHAGALELVGVVHDQWTI